MKNPLHQTNNGILFSFTQSVERVDDVLIKLTLSIIDGLYEITHVVLRLYGRWILLWDISTTPKAVSQYFFDWGQGMSRQTQERALQCLLSNDNTVLVLKWILTLDMPYSLKIVLCTLPWQCHLHLQQNPSQLLSNSVANLYFP